MIYALTRVNVQCVQSPCTRIRPAISGSHVVITTAKTLKGFPAERAGRSTVRVVYSCYYDSHVVHNPSYRSIEFPDKQPEDCILNHEAEEVVDLALEKLQDAGIMMVEWRSVLYHRMNVPLVIRVGPYVW